MPAYTSNASGDWTTTTIWTPNGLPGSGDTVTIDENDVVTAPATATTIDGITITAAGGRLNLGVGGMTVNGNVTINNATILGGGADRDMQINGDLSVGASAFTVGDVTVAGDVSTSAAPTVINLDLIVDATGGARTIEWNRSGAGQSPTSLRITGTGGDITKTATTYSRKLTVDAGAIYAGNPDGRIWYPVANNFCDIQGSMTGNGVFRIYWVGGDTFTNSGRVVPSSTATRVDYRSAGGTWVQTGEMNVNTNLKIYHTGSGVANFTNNGFTTIKNLDLGSGANASGKFTNNGTLVLESAQRLVGATSAANAFELASGFIELTGTITGTNVAFTADADACHIVNPTGGAGRFTDVEPDTQVHSHECTVDGDCTNISDNTERYPYQSVLGVA